MILRPLIAFVFGCVLAGCATSPVKLEKAQDVPTNRRLSGFRFLAAPSRDAAKIIVVRDSGVLGFAAKAKLLVDGAPIATFVPGERLTFYLRRGDHILAVVPQPQLMGALTENSFSISQGRDYYFRISISETSFKIQPTTQVQ